MAAAKSVEDRNPSKVSWTNTLSIQNTRYYDNRIQFTKFDWSNLIIYYLQLDTTKLMQTLEDLTIQGREKRNPQYGDFDDYYTGRKMQISSCPPGYRLICVGDWCYCGLA